MSEHDAETAHIHDRLREDSELAPLVEEHGPLTVEPAEDIFERFVRSILRQQVSMAAADAIEKRLFDAVEVTPAGVLAADEETLADAGLSSQKTRYVRNVADAFETNDYSPDYFAELSDEEVRDELTAITGVGDWTVDMFLMFCLGREDVFPVGDLGIRKGMWRLYDEDMTRAEMRAKSEDWRPYRSYASRYLWRAVD